MIEDTVRRFIAEELSASPVDGRLTDLPLLETQVLDSLGLLQLVSFLEAEFGVVVEDEELVPRNFGSIHDISRLVHEKQ